MGDLNNKIKASRFSKIQIFKTVSSNAIGSFSFGMFAYGISFMLLRATHSPLSFRMNLVVAPLVSILSFIPVGNFVDTHDHKKIIFWGYLLRLICFILLGLSLPHFKGTGLLIPIAIFIALDSLLVNTRGTAYGASVRQLVDKDLIPKLSSLTTAFAAVSRIVAPVLGVTLYTLLSINALILTEMIATVLSLLLMMSLRFKPIEQKEYSSKPRIRQSQWTQFKETLQYMKTRPFFRDTIVAEIVINFFFTAVVTGSPFIVANELHLNNQTVAMIETGFPIGYLLGSLTMGILKAQRNFANKVLGSLAMVGVCILGMGLSFIFSNGAFMVGSIGLLIALILDYSFAIFDLSIQIRIQSTVNAKMLGRVGSTLGTASSAISPIGTLFFTALFSIFSKGSIIFVVSGSLLILYAAMNYRLFSNDIKKMMSF